MSTPRTFPTVLAQALRTDPGRPFVTFYDESTGERVELSVTTYANWVAKASSLLASEHGLERGDRITIDLPPHWLTFVFLGAAWNVGLVVSEDDAPDAVVCGPDTVASWADTDAITLACSLLPMGVRFADPLPAGVHDVGIEVWGQPDAFIPWNPPEPSDIAIGGGEDEVTQDGLWPGDGETGRVLITDDSPGARPALTGALAGGGSIVLVVQADPDRLRAIAETERVSHQVPTQ